MNSVKRISTLAVYFSALNYSFAYSQARTSASADALFVLHGMADAREKFKSGICTIDYSEERGETGLKKVSEPERTKIHLWFAADGSFRMDWTYPKAVAEQKFVKSPTDVAWNSDERTGYFIRTKRHTVEWLQGRPEIEIGQPDAAVPRWIKYFDVKALGYNSWVEWNQGKTWEDDLRSDLKDPNSFPKVLEHSKDVLAMVWQAEGRFENEWVVEVDISRGFTPFHAIMRQRRAGTNPWQTVQEFTAAWQREGDVWVPVHYEALIVPESPTVATTRLKLNLSWTNVNEDIPSTVFSYEALGAPNEVGVVDTTLGTVVEIKTPVAARTAAPRSEFMRTSRFWPLVTGSSLLIMLIVVLLVRRVRARHQPS